MRVNGFPSCLGQVIPVAPYVSSVGHPGVIFAAIVVLCILISTITTHPWPVHLGLRGSDDRTNATAMAASSRAPPHRARPSVSGGLTTNQGVALDSFAGLRGGFGRPGRSQICKDLEKPAVEESSAHW